MQQFQADMKAGESSVEEDESDYDALDCPCLDEHLCGEEFLCKVCRIDVVMDEEELLEHLMGSHGIAADGSIDYKKEREYYLQTTLANSQVTRHQTQSSEK